MLRSHSDTILERLHDQYLRGLDCDVIITAVDHLATNVSESANATSNQDLVWKSLSCHKNVLRAASSFFDRVFANKFTYEKLEVDEGVEGMLVRTENDDRTSLQIFLHRISSHSVQALVNFAYTGFAAVETNILRRAIEDFKLMNVLAVIDKLESRLEEPLSVRNCITNFIISYVLENQVKYREVLSFILEKFFCGLEPTGVQKDEIWKRYHETVLSVSEMNIAITTEMRKEATELETLGLAEDKCLALILLELLEKISIGEAEETKLTTFLITGRREKCTRHLNNILLHCYTDKQDVCVECLVDGHVKHHLEPIETATYNRFAPYWDKVEEELETVKLNAKDRIIELEELSETIFSEKSRDLKILERCAELKPKLERLSIIFQSKKLDACDDHVLALENFVGALKSESTRSENDYKVVKAFSVKMMNLMQGRCTSCASIADAVLEFETIEDIDELDLHQPLLSAENCISLLKRSKKDGNQETYDEAFKYLLTNFIDIVKQRKDNFHRRINQSELESLLNSDKLKVEIEDELIPIVADWLQFDYRQRKKFTAQLFKQVRFGLVSEKMLIEIEADPMHVIMVNLESKQWLQNAINGACNHNRRDSMLPFVIAFGDNGINMLFNSFRNTWECWKWHDKRRCFGAVTVGNNIFIIGGVDHYEDELSKVSIYNVNTKIWKTGPKLREARFLFGTCVSSTNRIYVLGGRSINNEMNSVEVLSCDENCEPMGEWQTLPSMSTVRSDLEAVVIENRIYAIGGYESIATMEVFDHQVNRWMACKSMSQGKHEFSSVTYRGEIYVFGQQGHCEKYNPTTDTWKTISALSKPISYRGSVVLNDKVYLIGGYNCAEVDIYDIGTNTWSKGPPMPKPIGNTKCVSYA